MADDDWYRGSDWSPATQEVFFAKLGRARAQRVQYLRIKGCGLTESGDPAVREAGRELLRRVVTDHPDDFNAGPAHHDLGASLAAEGDTAAAVPHFEAAMRESVVDSYSDLALVEAILVLQLVDRYREALTLLERNQERASSPFPATRFRWSLASARLCQRLGSQDDAAALATVALRCLEAESPFARHPGVGLAGADETTIAELRMMAA